MTLGRIVATTGTMALVAFGLTNLGLMIAWRMESTQGFHAVMNLVLLPIWFMSGAFFPATDAPTVLRWAMRLDPLTYGLAALRECLYLGRGLTFVDVPTLGTALAVSGLFGIATLVAASAVAERSGTL